MVKIERRECACDHCHEIGQGVIIWCIFAGDKQDCIQLCNEHAKWIGKELVEG